MLYAVARLIYTLPKPDQCVCCKNKNNNNNNKIYFFRVELLVKTIVKIIALTRPLCIIENSA